MLSATQGACSCLPSAMLHCPDPTLKRLIWTWVSLQFGMDISQPSRFPIIWEPLRSPSTHTRSTDLDVCVLEVGHGHVEAVQHAQHGGPAGGALLPCGGDVAADRVGVGMRVGGRPASHTLQALNPHRAHPQAQHQQSGTNRHCRRQATSRTRSASHLSPGR